MSMNNIVVISFNSLFVGMSFAIGSGGIRESQEREKFQFPFRRDELCNIFSMRATSWQLRSCFNSLFVGMSFAMHSAGIQTAPIIAPFQFPFRRDELCNRDTVCLNGILRSFVSIPFSSGWALQFPCYDHPDLLRTGVSIPFSSGWALQLGSTSRSLLLSKP